MVASAVATIVWSSAERNIASISPRMMRLTVAWSRRAGGAEGAVTKELRTNENGARAAPVHDENAVVAKKFKAQECRGGMRAGLNAGLASPCLVLLQALFDPDAEEHDADRAADTD